MLRCIDVVDLIGEDGLLAEYQKSMRKSTWYKELTLVVLGELHHDIFTEGG